MSTPESPAPATSSYANIISEFVIAIDSLHTTFPLTTLLIEASRRANRKQLFKFIDTRGEKQDPDLAGGVIISNDAYPEYSRLERQMKRADLAAILVPRSFLSALVSQYDAYLGLLVRQAMLDTPGRINTSEKPITFKELNSFGSIEEARQHVIDTEIEALLRKSHEQQIDWIEKQFKLSLRANLATWPHFIELTERRNLLVHTSGRVSKQYLMNCGKNDVVLPSEVQLGSTLDVDQNYFKTAADCITELGVRVGQELWRKIQRNESPSADASLIEITFRLLVEKRYQLAAQILDFASSGLTKKSKDEDRRVLIINQAQAYKWMGQTERAIEILDSLDWTACSRRFRLCELTLRGRHDEAIRLFEQMGSNDELGKNDYRNWPVFQELRQDPKFKQAFLNLFGEDLEKRSDNEPTEPAG
jgi:hypothetical protein